MERPSALIGLAVLVGGCGDPPLAPDEERAALAGSGAVVLPAPSNLTATATSPSQIHLAWRDNSSAESGFQVYRSTSGPSGTFALLTKTAANVTTYSNKGLSPSTQYCYKIRAVGGTSNKPKYSAFSNTSCAALPATPPTAPSGLTATAVSASRIDLSWTDNASDETGFNIEGCQSDGCTAFVELAQVGANIAAWSHTGLSASTTYRYRVRARRGTVFSEYSSSVVATTMPSLKPPVAPLQTNTRPWDTAIEVTWSSSTWDEDGFRIQRSMDGGLSWSTVGTRPQGYGHFYDGPPIEQEVCYRVVAFNVGGDSEPSNIDCTVIPTAASNLVATAPDYQTIEITWDDASGSEDGYQLQCADTYTMGEFYDCAWFPANTMSFRFAGLNAGDWYFFQIRPTRDGGWGGFSNQVYVETPPAPE